MSPKAQPHPRDQPVADFFDGHGRPGAAGLLAVVRHPIAFARALGAIRALPVLEAHIGSAVDAHIVRAGLLRSNRVARELLAGTTAVLTLPTRRGEFVQGSSNSKRSLRTRVNKANRLGFTWERVEAEETRKQILDLTNAYELNHPIQQYRGTRPSTSHLLKLKTWLLARTADGRPLLLAIPAVDGEWAVLEHFRTLEDSEEARIARYWMSAVLADELVGVGVRYLADMLSPFGLSRGLRLFQRRLGYRYVRVRVRQAVWRGAQAFAVSAERGVQATEVNEDPMVVTRSDSPCNRAVAP